MLDPLTIEQSHDSNMPKKSALKGHNRLAQGNALGIVAHLKLKP